MAGIKKIDFQSIKKKYSKEPEYKPDRFFDLGDAFLGASGIPGPAMGHINMFLGHSDTGKAQPLTSNVLTPNGWKKMGDIQLGDEIIGSDGNTQYVIGIYPQGKRPVYKVTTKDSSVVFCDEEHLWTVSEYKGKNDNPDISFKVMKLKDMVENTKVKSGNYILPKLSPVNFKKNENFNIDPYVLGCFIGDGTCEDSSAIIFTKDTDLLTELKNTIHFESDITSEQDVYGEENVLIETKKLTSISLNKEAKKEIINLGLNVNSYEKFIPKNYIYSATIEERISLLQGILDTDGTVDKISGTAYFNTTSKQLSEDVMELVKSLGGKAEVSERIIKYNDQSKEGSAYFTLSIIVEGFTPFRLKRKIDLYKSNSNCNRYIDTIEFSHEEECHCIKVSNADELYVTDGFVLTHNTTALLKTAVDAQRKGILPVFIITEQKWSWEHAELIGFNRDADYLFNADFNYIEQITDYINDLLDAQEKGEIPYDMCILWDSVGSVPCKMTYDGKGGKQHTASVLADKIGMGLNQRISGSRKLDKIYTNTMVIINQPWVELPDNPFGQPKIKAKGGESIWLNSTLVFLFGNQKGAGTTKLAITKDKRRVKIASRSKISIMKNHVNGLGYEDGRILVTAHGFMHSKDDTEEKKSIEEYKKSASDYISKMLGVNPSEIEDTDIITETTSED